MVSNGSPHDATAEKQAQRIEASQPWILSGEQSGLLTLTATMEKRIVVRSDEKLTAFLELERVSRESSHFPNAG
jgi:hypothetical protein